MFITLKQLEEEKRKAVSEAQDRIWLCERIDKLEQRVRELEERLRVLEYPQDKTCSVEGVTNG